MLKSSSFLPIATALVGVGVFALATQVRAGGDKVKFPDGFDKGVLYTTVDRADNKQYRELYTSQAAIDAAKKGQPMPDGTVVTLVQYKAKLDAQGNPEKDANGRFIKDTLRQYAVMRKEKGWGADYPADKRNGEWEYRIFTADHQWNDKVPAGVCLDCHLPKASQDFVWSYENLKKAP